MLRDRREEFARLITAESGLCWKDSLYEASRAYDVWSFAAQLTIKDDGEIYSCDISPNGKSRKIYTTRLPLLGVISAITPFNHPLNMVSHKLAPAIATNNRVVLKPTELTPLTALALADVLYEAGLPPEMLSVVTGNPSTMGDAMITDPARRPRHLHGLGQGRQAHRRDGGLQAPRARARRQRSADRHGGRRPRQRGRARRPGRDQELGPALHGGEAHPRREERRGRIQRARAGEGEEAQIRRPDGPGDRCRHRHQRALGGAVRGAASTMPSRRARGSCTATNATARCSGRPSSTDVPLRLRARARGDLRPGDPDHPLPGRHRRASSGSRTRRPMACRPASAPTVSTTSPASSPSSRSGR